jgi:hypothetical protein
MPKWRRSMPTSFTSGKRIGIATKIIGVPWRKVHYNN